MASCFLSVKRWHATAVLLLLWLRLCAGSHKVGFQISRKILKKLKNTIFLWVLFIFTVQRQGLWRGLCSVCVQARTKSVFISYARVRKSWKSCFPMSVVHLYCPMARPVGRVLLWTPPEVSVSFHWFSLYFHRFSLYFHWFFIYFH